MTSPLDDAKQALNHKQKGCVTSIPISRSMSKVDKASRVPKAEMNRRRELNGTARLELW
jgi:hypothetical protein